MKKKKKVFLSRTTPKTDVSVVKDIFFPDLFLAENAKKT